MAPPLGGRHLTQILFAYQKQNFFRRGTEKQKVKNHQKMVKRTRRREMRREKEKSTNFCVFVRFIFTRSCCFCYFWVFFRWWGGRCTILKGALTRRPFSQGEIKRKKIQEREGRYHGGMNGTDGRVFSSIFKVIDARDS